MEIGATQEKTSTDFVQPQAKIPTTQTQPKPSFTVVVSIVLRVRCHAEPCHDYVVKV